MDGLQALNPINRKNQFAYLYQMGEFGNASPTWTSIKQLLEWGKQEYSKDGKCWNIGNELFHLRNRVAAGETHYNLNWTACVNMWYDKPNKDDWYVSMMCPTEKTIFQGEVIQVNPWRVGAEKGAGGLTQSLCGLELMYTTIAKPMREALALQRICKSGIIASLLLKHYLCPNSYDWLMHLLEEYPGHTVEFSTFSTKWGTLYPRFNTVFWEVRQY